MLLHWLLYGAGMVGALVFHAYFWGWFSWFMLVLGACLPLFSLLVSLPAMVRVRVRLELPAVCRRGEGAYATLGIANGFLPVPRCRFRFHVLQEMTGQDTVLREEPPGHDSWYVPVDTRHCGCIRCWTEKGRVYDYLGLFAIPMQKSEEAELLVRPQAVSPEKLPNLSHFLVRRRQPKPGGGFSEEHELREYRPGDSLRDIHWKLSVKTDAMIIREAQEPIRDLTILTLDLTGSAETVDQVLEQLSWLSRWLLDHETEHQVIWIDPESCQMVTSTVTDGESLEQTLEQLLRSSLRADTPSIAGRRFPRASWRYHIQPRQEVQP